MQPPEFRRSRGLSFGTLNRHLKKQRWKRKSRRASLASRLVPVELAAGKLLRQYEPSCGLAVVLSKWAPDPGKLNLIQYVRTPGEWLERA